MKLRIAALILIILTTIAILAGGCVSKKHCQGLSAHPNYKTSWSKH